MRQLCIWVLSVLFPGLVFAQTTLEIPAPGQILTGVGLVSGWSCRAGEIDVRLTEGEALQPVPSGSSRMDTANACQNEGYNGFSLLVNWNNLGEGTHTLTLYVDSEPVVSRQVTVVTLGEEFIRGLEKTVTLTQWPDWRTDVKIAWSEAKQNFEIVEIDHLDIPPDTPPLLTQLLGRWYFQDEENGFIWLGYTFTEIDGEQVTGTTDDGIFPVFGRLNTTRWLGQPLMQYELYILLKRSGSEGTRPFCHVYVFNVDTATNTAKGYYWDGIGSTLEECEQNADGPYRASGGQY